MDKHGIYFMIHSLALKRGGMTRAAITRAMMLRHHYPHIGLLTFNFNPDYAQVLADLMKANVWHSSLQHINVYAWLMAHYDVNMTLDDVQRTLKHEPYERQETYDKEGRLRKLTVLNRETKATVADYFFTHGGYCFFTREFDPVTKKTLRCTWHKRDGEKQSFPSVIAYRRHFVEAIAKQHDYSVLLSDGRFSDRILFAVDHPKVAKVAMLHSNHLQFPYDYGSRLVKRNASLLHNLHQLDAFVALTQQQAEDIRSRFGDRTTIHVIGHPAPIGHPHPTKGIDHHTAVIVSRYTGIKQIHHAIQAFKKVVRKIPQARLEIWGFGDEEERYRRLIKKFKLEKHVFVQGFAQDVQAVFARAAFSILTSKSEAFAMAIVESMAVGTPVLCYACQYGPVDLVKHKVNGLLVAPKDIDGLAEAMIALFSDRKKRQALSNEALKVKEQYSQEKIAQQWVHVFRKALQQRDTRISLQPMKATLESLFYKSTLNTFFLNGSLFLQHNDFSEQEKQQVKLTLQLRRQRDIADVYLPVDFSWKNDKHIQFSCDVADVAQLSRGRWKVRLNFSCLNASQFVTMKGSTVEAKVSRLFSLPQVLFTWHISEATVCIHVHRSQVKRWPTFRAYRHVLLSRLKARIDKIERF